MTKLSLSQRAIDKICADKLMLEDVRGGPLQPVLVYHLNCWATDLDGRTTEYGPGFGLKFLRAAELVESDYIAVKTGDLDVFVRLDGLAPDRTYLIDHADWRFALVD
jgi:hypothetical protein